MPLHETDIGSIETAQWGEGRERIVLLHCAGAGPSSLATLATNLASSGRMLIAPALNKYGRTRVTGADPIQEHVDVAAWVVNHYAGDANSVSLFGHSMGGLVALKVAQEQPCCDHVVVYDPIAPGVLDENDAGDRDALAWDRDIVIGLRRAVAEDEPERGVSRFIEAWNDTPWARLPESVRGELVSGAPRLAREIDALSYHDACALGDTALRPTGGLPAQGEPTQENQCQVTLFTGEASPVVAGRMVSRLGERFACSNVCSIAEAGHMYPVTQGAEMAKLIDRILTGFA